MAVRPRGGRESLAAVQFHPLFCFVGSPMAEDPDQNDVTTTTLSCTFFDKGAEASKKHMASHSAIAESREEPEG